jgi:hypothetical protein
VDSEEQRTIKFAFTEATDHLGFSAAEQAQLLNGKSPNDPGTFTKANIGDVTGPLAQVSLALGLILDDENCARAFVRAKDLPGLECQSIAECILSRSPEKISRAIHAMEAKLDLC